ncbi:MAG: galactose-1-phosphate uridylyltransferase [bacterium]
MNQFRRNPVTGHWSVIIQDEYDLHELLSKQQSRKQGGPDDANQCHLCGGYEAETPPEIYAIRYENSQKNESDWSVRVVPDKQPFLQIFGDLNNRGVGMYDVLDGIGAHELVVETPEHNVPIFDLKLESIKDILAAYRERILDLKRDTRFRYVLIHKNHGESHRNFLNHSYSQIFATPITPTRVKTELLNAMEHYQYKERCLFCDIIHQERAAAERVIVENDRFLATAPFASRSPFEVWIYPKEHETFFEWNGEHTQLAEILKSVLKKMHIVLNNPNFIMVLLSGPNIGTGKLRGYWKTLERDFHWHIEIMPRFRGSASFDVGSGFHVNVVSPESAANILKNTDIDQQKDGVE